MVNNTPLEATCHTYYWDFFGPRAEGTAKHFLAHLDAFLQKHVLDGCKTGVDSSGSGHQAVFCKTPDAHADLVKRVLKPQRAR